MTREEAEEVLADENPDALFFEGYDEAIIGIARRTNLCVVAYDAEKILACLMRQGMDYDEAEEFFGYNVQCAWMGDQTPIIIS